MDACNIERNTYETSHRITAASGGKNPIISNYHAIEHIYIYMQGNHACISPLYE